MDLPPNKPIQMGILSSPAYLPVVRAAMEKTCSLMGFDHEQAGNMMLCLDEALTNVIRHAYDGATDRPIEIELTPLRNGTAGGLRIRVRDHGRCVERSKIKSRDLSDVRPGGLGVHIMTQCMDSVDYAPADGGGTILTMTKTLPPGKEGDPS